MAVEAPEAGHNAAVVRKPREMNAAVRLTVSFLFSPCTMEAASHIPKGLPCST